MSTILNFDFNPRLAWTLGATLRNILDSNGNPVRIELLPRSPLTGNTEFTDSSLSDYTVANNTHLTTADANTTFKDHLYLQANTDNVQMESGSHTCTRYYQTVTGDFDVYSRIRFGDERGIQGVWLSAFATDVSNNWATQAMYVDGNSLLNIISRFIDEGFDTAVNTPLVAPNPNVYNGISLYIRLKRATNTFSTYYSFDGLNWTQQGSNKTLSSMTSDAQVGVGITTYNTSGTAVGFVDFIRTWPPYDAGDPTAHITLDSGKNGTIWTMSTFQDYLNEYEEYAPYAQIGFGSLKYDYGASDSPGTQTLTGTYSTTSGMQGQSDPTGRYFELSVQFHSPNGYELAKFCGASIDAVTNWA